jgi:regulator of sigma E protease
VTIVAFVFVLGLLVFVHELGHFLVAKRAGIVVEEFAFGYPPRLVRLWQNEGRVVLDGQAMVLGKSIKLPRMLDVGQTVAYRTSLEADGRKVVSYIEVLAKNAETGEVAESSSTDLEIATVDEIQRGTEYSINWIPFGGYVKMLGEEDPKSPGSFASKSKRARIAVLVAGAAMNLVLAIVVFSATYLLGAPEPVASDNVLVMAVSPGSPADEIGLRMGDIVVSIDGLSVASPDELVSLTDERLGQEMALAVRRGQELLEFDITPRRDPPPGEGAMGITIQAAVSRVDIKYYPLPQALWMGIQQTLGTITLTLSIPVMILRGLIPAEAVRPIGPLGIYQQTASAVNATIQMGWWYPILSLVGLISTALAITNLLPLPALDGGRILFILIEAVRGKRIDPAREGLVHFVGIAVLLTLMLVVTYFDIMRPVTAMDWTSLF